MAVRLLLATPDRGLAAAARQQAVEAGWRLCVATSAEEAVDAAQHAAVDVAVVDDRLEAIGGRTVSAWLARVSEGAAPRLLRLGAPDDHAADMHRPVTIAQLETLVTQGGDSPNGISQWSFSLDPDALAVRSADRLQLLTPTEYRLLRVLLSAGAAGASPRAMVAAIGKVSSLRVHIANLRRKLRLVTEDVTNVVAEQGSYRLRQVAAH